jgi:hypothetical protein
VPCPPYKGATECKISKVLAFAKMSSQHKGSPVRKRKKKKKGRKKEKENTPLPSAFPSTH